MRHVLHVPRVSCDVVQLHEVHRCEIDVCLVLPPFLLYVAQLKVRITKTRRYTSVHVHSCVHTNYIRARPHLVFDVQETARQVSQGDEIVADALCGIARHGIAQRTVDHTRCPAVGIRENRQVPTRGVAQRVEAVLHASVISHALVI